MFERSSPANQNLRDSELGLFDPAQFNDPVALQTEWTPAQSNYSTSFCTHRLVQVNPSRIEFQPTLPTTLIPLLIIIMVIFIILFFFPFSFSSPVSLKTIFSLFFGLIFICGSGFLYYKLTTPIVFDRHMGFFWKSRQMPYLISPTEANPKNYARLEQVHALQLLSELDDEYYCFELNLVLKNSRRINVVDHGNKAKLLADAEALSKFLDKPIWDATLE